MTHLPFILFVFAVGACIGSFLNVVIWRLPRGESLSHPGSHCPKCNTPLAWKDNIPVFGWLKLGGRCRYCREPISPRYPIVEAVTGLLFVFYYAMFFIFQIGPCAAVTTPAVTEGVGGAVAFRPALMIQKDWAMYGLYMALIAGLLAASLIDAELFIIPLQIPWLLAGLGVVVHAIIDTPRTPGALNVGPVAGALAAGGALGPGVSLLLWSRNIIPMSFPHGEPMLEVDQVPPSDMKAPEGKKLDYAGEIPPKYTKSEIRREIGKELVFLLPPMVLAVLWLSMMNAFPAFSQWWERMMRYNWLSGLLGSIFGALIGAFVVWITRILGTLGFGRVAMGLGDVHLMFGVGAIVGAGAATVAFFIAPFFGLVLALWMIATGTRRELPYGPYLSLATGFCLLFYCDIAAYLAPGMAGLMILLSGLFG